VSEALLIGDRRPYTVLLVVPNYDSLEPWARHKGIAWQSREQLARLPEVRAKLEREVAARLDGFARHEMPKKVLPLVREFSLERDEITPTLKIKRRVVEQAYSAEIEAIYAEPAVPNGTSA
jgi:long-chain acyl-CoA synthetase